MSSYLQTGMRAVTACVMAVIFTVPQSVFAETHVISPSELQKQAVDATHDREQNLNTLRRFLSTPTADKAMKSSHIDPTKVQGAVSSLSDDELASLAQRAAKAQADFTAGSLSDRDLIWIIVAIAALVLIIVAVR